MSLTPQERAGNVDVTSMEDTKTCSACGETKSVDSFYRYKRHKDGRLGVCKRCFLARKKLNTQRRSVENRWLWMYRKSLGSRKQRRK